MCGICGIVKLSGISPEVDNKNLQRMLDKIHHRGPDDYGVFSSDYAILGNKRLAIIDLKTGKQPIFDSTNRYVIVYNGELYNYKELKVLLEKIGYSFKTETDTEVILLMYLEFGQKCLSYLNGMYAFVIWDKETKVLFGGRDRFGIKPFFLTSTNHGTLFFSSELKSILANPEIKKVIDYESLQYYFCFEYIPAPSCMIKDVIKLPPASYFTFSKNGLNIQRYWKADFNRSENRPPTTLADYLPELDRRLKKSVEMEMMSDVPIGLFLSGGLDSSTIAYYANKVAEERLSNKPLCFSIRFTDSSFDESQYAKLLTDTLGLKHEVLTLQRDDLSQGVEEALKIIDEPFADASLVPTSLLCKFASQLVKVVLGGDGGDEIFAGYPTYQAHEAIKLYERVFPYFIRAQLFPRLVSKIAVSDAYLSLEFKLKKFLSGRGLPPEVRHYKWLGAFTREDQLKLLQVSSLFIDNDIYKPASKFFLESIGSDPLNKILYCDMNLYLPGNILTKLDTASMQYSLEARVPLLNNHLVSFVQEIPSKFKLNFFRTKYILKCLMNNKLPKKIVWRKKHGFGFPLGSMLKGELRNLLCDVLSSDKLSSDNIFKPNFVRELIEIHCKNKADLSKPLWAMLVFQNWYDSIKKM